MREMLGKAESLPELVEIVREAGGPEAAMEEARRLGREAQEALETLPKGRVREALEATASFVTQRES
jgi:geranylgeranyl pyrophosphate synthase